MQATTIAESIPALEELLNYLDKAYWESSSIDVKDSIYDFITAINRELFELGKLSIQDHDLGYEPISTDFILASRRLTQFRKYLDTHIVRASTIAKIDASISSIITLVTPTKDTNHG